MEQHWQTGPAGVLTDVRTGWQWTAADNGQDIEWAQALIWCEQLELDGGGWTLPSVRQLQGLYVPGEAVGTSCGSYLDQSIRCGVSSQFQLSGPFLWSRDPSGESHASGVFMANGYPLSYIRSARFNDRALCVRVPVAD